MRILISVLFLIFVFNAIAEENTRIECHGQGHDLEHPADFTVQASIASPSELKSVYWRKIADNKIFEDNRALMEGEWDSSRKSPQDGLRYYFRQGNTTSFLHIPPEGIAFRLFYASDDEIADSLRHDDHRFEFPMEYVFEQYEHGGSQDVDQLLCKPVL